MIDRSRFEAIRSKHGGYASWAVWAKASNTPKSNIGDMTIFDTNANDSLLKTLKASVLMVGLNISRSFSEPFRNFHDASSSGNDFKIRYAFEDTEYYGAYMTDIIKNVEMVESSKLLEHLKTSPVLVRQNVDTFCEEVLDLDSGKPTVLAFGKAAHSLIEEFVPRHVYQQLIKLTHYSHWISKEDYRRTVLDQVGSAAVTHN